MKNRILLFLSLSLMIITSSCIFIGTSIKGNGNVVEQTRKIASFDEIKISRGMNVYISQGEAAKVVVKADENLLNIIKTEVVNNTLKITTTGNIRKSTSKKVMVTMPKIKGVSAFAGSNAFSETILESKYMEVNGSAGSNVKLKVKAEELNVSSSAGSNIYLEGSAKIFSGKATAGANIKAEALKTEICNASAGSGANVWISVTEKLEGKASSGGNIFYYGNPGATDTESSSGGNIIKK